jgi:hypothetical protein
VSASKLGAVLLLLTACGGAAGGTHDPRDAREPNWRDPSSSRSDTFSAPREMDRGRGKDVKEYKGK